MKKILVPCDFSEPAINAYRQALDVAAKWGATVHLLHVIEPPVVNDTLLMARLYFEEEEMNESKSKAEAQLVDLIKRNKNELVKNEYEVKFGSVADTVQEQVEEKEIDLVIMGSKGASGLKEFFIGSNAEEVVRQSSVPVLIVKNYYSQPIRKIVFPNTLDTEHQEDLAMKIKELQDFFKAKLCIVYISVGSQFEDEGTIRQHLSQFANRYMFKDYTINIHHHVSTEKGIIEFTKVVGGDMVALGTHGRQGLVRFIKGSVAEDIVNHIDCPIWTYHIKEEKLVKTQN